MWKPAAASDTESALWLSPECPYPLAGGGALRSASLLHYLVRRSPVDAVIFREPGAPDPREQLPAGLVRRLCVLDLPAHRRDRAARMTRNALRLARGVPPLVDRFVGFSSALAAFLQGRRYALALIEHFWCAPYWDLVSPAAVRTVLDLHNIESALHASCARSEPALQAAAHRLFSRASLALERRWLPRFDRVLVASKQDAARVAVIAPRACVSVYPNALPLVPVPACRRDFVVAFSANFDYHPNRTAVEFFARRIWPALRACYPQLRWRLVGKNDGAVRPLIAGDPRIETTGPLPDAVAELARARVAVVPVLSGSGTRLKILEAWAAETAVVSTTLGAEGLHAVHGENILLGDTPVDFITAIQRLLDDDEVSVRIAVAGRRTYQSEYTWESVWSSLEL